ncbi:hypothetical protein AGABI1DRAFT_32292 [Agaricus bisporus var. burnettii JB137-S8]|uniref:Uncharacterized protein n=1 Tax=Agaricus bisporus var. burnettii (strain JB137-S8 / ATCC MYA-4627 / FGSC 10392) TaxID=597362 RepID=K5X8S6_AGABU|nr:uncharacterized protein AGABI1DRAFT_32292 [Agaricus bisporus var. burnettii JB137-S8]EKM84331.1 hypothetical protein AGABI1DRAFT_32292 [Agaricus bisporus var. burnettii JB137-S8]
MPPPPAIPPPLPLAVTTQTSLQSGIELGSSLRATPVVIPSLQPIGDRDHTLQLGSGVVLYFRASEIPDGSPVPILSKDLPRLGKIWDDTHSSWDPALAPLVIQGHPIALKYWQVVYRRDPKGRWNYIKKYWHNWKMIAERWHKSTPENFWAEFMDENGKQKSYTQILEELREQRKQDCLAIAASAQEEYGDIYFSKFSYHKKGKRVAMTDPRAVSRHYKRCKTV